MPKHPSPYQHIIAAQQFTIDFIFELFALAEQMQKQPESFINELKNKIVSVAFYEPSTRTRFSFESATYRLGGSVITTENAKEFSSAAKGETLEDSIKILSKYCNFIVLRHTDDDSSERAVPVSSVPLINAGSGSAQHPTQALLDAYTIWKEFGRLDNLKIAVVGDLLRGRTCSSLIYLLAKFNNNHFYFVAPENCQIKDGLREHLEENKQAFEELNDLASATKNSDIVYMTRIQKERFTSPADYEKAKGKYILNSALAETMKPAAIIMHPLPRVNEITPDVDDNPRARYFEQAENGLWVRMALLKMLNDSRYGK